MPNVMVALPNIGGALCTTPHSLASTRCCAVTLPDAKPVEIYRGASNYRINLSR